MPRIEELAPNTGVGFIIEYLWHGQVMSHEFVTTMTWITRFLWVKNKCLISGQPNLSRAKVQQPNLFGFLMLYTYQKGATIQNSVIPMQLLYWTKCYWLADQMAKGYWVVGAALLHFSCIVNDLLSMSVRSSTLFQQEGSTKKKKKHLWMLFKDTTTIMNHKHQFYGSVNQLNGSHGGQPLTLSYQIKPIM